MPFSMGEQGGEALAHDQKYILLDQLDIGLGRGLDQQHFAGTEGLRIRKGLLEILIQVILHARVELELDSDLVQRRLRLRHRRTHCGWGIVVGAIIEAREDMAMPIDQWVSLGKNGGKDLLNLSLKKLSPGFFLWLGILFARVTAIILGTFRLFAVKDNAGDGNLGGLELVAQVQDGLGWHLAWLEYDK